MTADRDESQRVRLGSRVRIPPHVVYRGYAAETVIVNVETERYHGLNPTAGRMLAALDGPGTVDDAATTVAEQTSRPRDEVQADILDLCSRLLERGLIELAGDPAS